jgi:hypothetical protein
MQISKGVRWLMHGSWMVIAIYLGSTYLINFGLSSKSQKTPDKTKFQAADEARFRPLFDTGSKALANGQYTEALASFLEAERATEQLTDEQYDSLKKSRERIADAYETAGNYTGAESVFLALANSGIREGQTLFQAKELDRALVRAQDAEQFANHLTSGKQDSLQASRDLLVNCLTGLHRYPEAVEAHQRMIDYLKGSVESYDEAFIRNYMSLAHTYSEANNWNDAEQTLFLAIESCDATQAHLSGMAGTDQIVSSALVNKNIALHDLVIAYYREGKTDNALSKADEFFGYASEQIENPANPQGYAPADIAKLGLQIATEAKRQDSVDLWRHRVNQPSLVVYRLPGRQ